MSSKKRKADLTSSSSDSDIIFEKLEKDPPHPELCPKEGKEVLKTILQHIETQISLFQGIAQESRQILETTDNEDGESSESQAVNVIKAAGTLKPSLNCLRDSLQQSLDSIRKLGLTEERTFRSKVVSKTPKSAPSSSKQSKSIATHSRSVETDSLTGEEEVSEAKIEKSPVSISDEIDNISESTGTTNSENKVKMPGKTRAAKSAAEAAIKDAAEPTVEMNGAVKKSQKAKISISKKVSKEVEKDSSPPSDDVIDLQSDESKPSSPIKQKSKSATASKTPKTEASPARRNSPRGAAAKAVEVKGRRGSNKGAESDIDSGEESDNDEEEEEETVDSEGISSEEEEQPKKKNRGRKRKKGSSSEDEKPKRKSRRKKKSESESEEDEELKEIRELERLAKAVDSKSSKKKKGKKGASPEKKGKKKSKKNAGDGAAETVSISNDEGSEKDLLESPQEKDKGKKKPEIDARNISEDLPDVGDIPQIVDEQANDDEALIVPDSLPDDDDADSAGSGYGTSGSKSKKSPVKKASKDEAGKKAKKEQKSGSDSDDSVDRLCRAGNLKKIDSSDSEEEVKPKRATRQKNAVKEGEKKSRKVKKLKLSDESDVASSESEAESGNRSESPSIEEFSSKESDSDFEAPGTSKKAAKKKTKEEKEPKSKKGKKSSASNASGRSRRRVRMRDSSDEGANEIEEDHSAESGSDNGNKKNKSPGGKKKGIRKIMGKNKLAKETINAEIAERERKKRLEEYQKQFNSIVMEEEETGPSASEDHTAVKIKELILDKDGDYELSVHKDIVKHLKKHQAQGIKFMWNCTFETISRFKEGDKGGGGILAQCMGLGKTLQVISFAHTVLTCDKMSDEIRTMLVIAPVNVVLNWRHEFKIWCDDQGLDDVEYYTLTGGQKGASSVRERVERVKCWHDNGGVMIMGYEMYRLLVEPKKMKANYKKKLLECLRDPGPDIIVCDEGHKLKNEKTGISKALVKIKTRRRICLTGTPLQNNLEEYWTMISFVKPGLLGTKIEFQNRFSNPIKQGQFSTSNNYEVQIMRRRCHVLYKMLEDCVMRRDYTVLKPYLPPKCEYILFIRTCKRQNELYTYYLDKVSSGGERNEERGGNRKNQILPDYHMLSRIWTHPYNLIIHQREMDERAWKKDEDDFVAASDTPDESSDQSYSEHSSGEEEEVNSEKEKEIVKKWQTRRRRGAGVEGEDEIPVPPEETGEGRETPTELQGWWGSMVQEKDQFDLSLSGKLVVLFEIIKLCEKIGDKLLVFSQSLESLRVIESYLEYFDDTKTWFSDDHEVIGTMGGQEKWGWVPGVDFLRIDGQIPPEKRKKLQERFNHPSNMRARLFLISTRAGSLGINMVGANRVVIFDACWNPAHDTQSLFRVYRFGQTKPVYIYRFIAKGTMENVIYDRQVNKQALGLRVVDEQQIKRNYADKDVRELYRFNPDEYDPDTPADYNIPKDKLLADVLLDNKEWVSTYHDHDSLLEHQADETLNEEERKEAWKEYESARAGQKAQMNNPMAGHGAYGGASLQQMQQMLIQHRMQQYASQLTYYRNIANEALCRLPDHLRGKMGSFADVESQMMVNRVGQVNDMHNVEYMVEKYPQILKGLYSLLQSASTVQAQAMQGIYPVAQPHMGMGQAPMVAPRQGGGPGGQGLPESSRSLSDRAENEASREQILEQLQQMPRETVKVSARVQEEEDEPATLDISD